MGGAAGRGPRYRALIASLLAGSALLPLQRGLAADPARGRQLSIEHCARCHVIGDYNRTGGIGSTPSFRWMLELADYAERMRTFYTRPPHPVFVRVPGYRRWSNAPSYAPVFTITPDEIEDILAYVETLRGER